MPHSNTKLKTCRKCIMLWHSTCKCGCMHSCMHIYIKKQTNMEICVCDPEQQLNGQSPITSHRTARPRWRTHCWRIWQWKWGSRTFTAIRETANISSSLQTLGLCFHCLSAFLLLVSLWNSFGVKVVEGLKARGFTHSRLYFIYLFLMCVPFHTFPQFWCRYTSMRRIKGATTLRHKKKKTSEKIEAI